MSNTEPPPTDAQTESSGTLFTPVTGSLYLSDYPSINESSLTHSKITFIINCTSDLDHVVFPSLPNIEYARVGVWDMPTEDLSKHFHPICDRIHQISNSGGCTLVHCAKGISRSVSFCLAYLMKYEDLTLRKAFTSLQARRCVIHPNPGFWRQLIELEKELRGVATVKMLVYPQGAKPDVSEKELNSDRPNRVCGTLL
ncbi:hypothetical protein LSH36_257g01003 [Paralvinella palmiformis]|uniref:Protein-tyrosine-phosphatase n=1 Tax=Paralvinella palmiformis TaxID=53620 RepID=A0AAD9N589_9ANNE|nr:hypothetical protein LSH36_257g01003 [Paralvinella palmiformis]